MFDYIHLLALKLGYMQIFFTICIFFLFASLFVIGRYQWLMKRFSKEYYPARKYQEKNLCKYKDKCPSVYINSYYLYKNNPELKMDQARGKYLSYSFFKFIKSLSMDNNVILFAPDIDDNDSGRTLYKYIQYIKFQKLPITRIITEIPDNVKLKEVGYKEGGVYTNYSYLVKEDGKK